MKKTLFLVSIAAMLLFPAALAFSQAGADKASTEVINARLASEEVEGDFMTVWAEHFADFMREETDGRINITVYPYGTLGDTRDINELAQLGVVEFVFSDYAWISSFVAQANALALHYVWPRENIGEVLDWVVRNGDYLPMLEEKFRQNGLVPLGILFEGWQWLTAKRPVRTLADMRGLKTRIMGSQTLVKNYQAYGIDTVSLSYGEIYSALQTGLIDAQSQPMFANMSMGFYEVADYFVQLWAEPFLGIPTANMQFFNSLSAADQQLMRQFWADSVLPSAEWIMERNRADMEKIKEVRPQVSFLEFTDEQIAELRKIQVEKVYPGFPQVGGSDAEIILQALLNDIENAKAALGMK